MNHGIFERNSIILLIGILIVVSIGGIVQIAPLFWVQARSRRCRACARTPRSSRRAATSTSARAATCHSQMIRTLRDEVERYGHYSLAAEHVRPPVPVGLQRTGPDLARVGGKYSDQWHAEHMINPRAVVPESIMPGYPFLAAPLDYAMSRSV